jgi:hypothetical protein
VVLETLKLMRIIGDLLSDMNDELRMTNDEGMTKRDSRIDKALSRLRLRSAFYIRHSTFAL